MRLKLSSVNNWIKVARSIAGFPAVQAALHQLERFS
jgi:hypothetical protein